MKKIFFVTALLSANVFVYAQLGGNIFDKAKKKVEDKVNGKVEKKVDDTVNGKPAEESKAEENNSSTSNSTSSAAETSSAKVYSKFDFIPGEKVVVMEDFMQDAAGDFPDK